MFVPSHVCILTGVLARNFPDIPVLLVLAGSFGALFLKFRAFQTFEVYVTRARDESRDCDVILHKILPQNFLHT